MQMNVVCGLVATVSFYPSSIQLPRCVTIATADELPLLMTGTLSSRAPFVENAQPSRLGYVHGGSQPFPQPLRISQIFGDKIKDNGNLYITTRILAGELGTNQCQFDFRRGETGLMSVSRQSSNKRLPSKNRGTYDEPADLGRLFSDPNQKSHEANHQKSLKMPWICYSFKVSHQFISSCTRNGESTRISLFLFEPLGRKSIMFGA